MKTGADIDGAHWTAEYDPAAGVIHVWRDARVLGNFTAPAALFGDVSGGGAKSVEEHRVEEAALRAFLHRLAADLSPGSGSR
ncbi:MAG TPA: hypothetical protein VGO84_16940 [Burkholderiales bacterium]|jgi:hypothetical protein|nr:hypothetical protein [Burkholderiales bacterium]